MDLKQETIDEIQEMLLQKADELRKDKEMTPVDKLEKLNVILNTYKVLENYDYNIDILQKDLLKYKGDERDGI